MHGFMQPATTDIEPRIAVRTRLVAGLRKYRWLLLIVVFPTLTVAAYLYLYAADQYRSEAHYIVRAPASSRPAMPSGLGALLGGGGVGSDQSQAMSVSDYLTSHDVVAELRARADLVGRFRRPEADILSRLAEDNPTPEALLKYYRKQVDVHYDEETGITSLTVNAFRPTDAYAIARSLLTLGEQRVNTMNVRSFSDAVVLSRRQLGEAELALSKIQREMTAFRQTGRDVNPQGSATAQIGLVSQLNGNLSAARAQMALTAQIIGTDNPQHRALSQRVRSLETQVSAQQGRLAGTGTAIAAGLGDYERLQLQQQFLAKRYDAASAAFEAARQQAVQQQLYIVRVVDANLPQKSLYPKRATTVLTVFAALLVVWGIGWLLAAGVREHAV